MRSLTKTWGLAGLRAGYLLASAPHVRALGGPALAAVVACCAPSAIAEASAWAADLDSERTWLGRALSQVPGVAVAPSARASFLLLRVPAPSSLSSPTVRERLRVAGFAVRRGDTFPGLGQDWIRIAVRDRATNERFVAALSAVLEAS